MVSTAAPSEDAPQDPQPSEDHPDGAEPEGIAHTPPPWSPSRGLTPQNVIQQLGASGGLAGGAASSSWSSGLRSAVSMTAGVDKMRSDAVSKLLAQNAAMGEAHRVRMQSFAQFPPSAGLLARAAMSHTARLAMPSQGRRLSELIETIGLPVGGGFTPDLLPTEDAAAFEAIRDAAPEVADQIDEAASRLTSFVGHDVVRNAIADLVYLIVLFAYVGGAFVLPMWANQILVGGLATQGITAPGARAATLRKLPGGQEAAPQIK